MQLGFKDSTLRTLCNSKRKLHDRLGAGMARMVQRTLHSLDAAPSLADLSSLPPFSRRRLKDNAAKPYDAAVLYAVGAEGPGRIVFEPDIGKPSASLEEIYRVKILAIGEST